MKRVEAALLAFALAIRSLMLGIRSLPLKFYAVLILFCCITIAAQLSNLT